jgi:apolipoprotein D and lipocalin family protein
LGTWYENQRYFTLTEVGTRCGRIEYSQAPNGKFIAANTITSRL